MRPVSIYEFHLKLKAIGFHEVRFADSNYAAPSKDWLRDFAADQGAPFRLLETNGLAPYAPPMFAP